jgi:hypothetical protein
MMFVLASDKALAGDDVEEFLDKEVETGSWFKEFRIMDYETRLLQDESISDIDTLYQQMRAKEKMYFAQGMEEQSDMRERGILFEKYAKILQESFFEDMPYFNTEENDYSVPTSFDPDENGNVWWIVPVEFTH